jgi:O-antigen biosynthesis protein
MGMRRRLREHLVGRGPGWQALALVVWLRRTARRAQRSATLRSAGRVALESHLRSLAAVSLDFPLVAEPVASVIVPVFNQWKLTRDCLASLVLNAPLDRIEVIVVDDASTDETPQELTGIANVRVVRNSTNLGFTRTANRGAEAARGRFIVFLNNDTRVLPGWLEGLLSAMEDETVGAAGSGLMLPSGALQEAGALVWADGSGWNIGRGRSPSDPQYAFRRDVDYCSGASLMVRGSLFREIGGLDERFAPAYYEDTDLCFAFRSRGHRVVYEPSSTVIHFEGATHGTESRGAAPGAHGKENQYRNQAVFATKWSHVLNGHLPRPSGEPRSAELGGSRRCAGARVLVCNARIPAPSRDAGSHRMDWILRLLATMSAHVTVHPMYPIEEDGAASLRQAGVEVVTDSTAFRRFAKRRQGFYDLVVLSRLDTAGRLGLVRRYFPNATLVYDTVDLEFLRQERELAITGGVPRGRPRRSRRTELDLISACDVTAAVTDLEATLVREMVPSARVVVLPTVHNGHPGVPPAFEARRGLLFIGSFHHSPNADAMRFFIDEVLPRVRDTIDVELVVVGDAPPADLLRRQGPGLRFAGFVEDVIPLFDRARVFISPLRFGAGMKGKNAQAMSLGLPMVTTGVGAEGMDIVDGEHALVRDDPESFAAAVVQLHEDQALWQRLAATSRQVASARWSPSEMQRRLRSLIDGVMDDAARTTEVIAC